MGQYLGVVQVRFSSSSSCTYPVLERGVLKYKQRYGQCSEERDSAQVEGVGGRKRDVAGPGSGGGLDLEEVRKRWCVAG